MTPWHCLERKENRTAGRSKCRYKLETMGEGSLYYQRLDFEHVNDVELRCVRQCPFVNSGNIHTLEATSARAMACARSSMNGAKPARTASQNKPFLTVGV